MKRLNLRWLALASSLVWLPMALVACSGSDDDDSGDDDASVAGDDDSSSGDDDATTTGDDDATTTGDDDATTAGDDDATSTGDDDATTAGDDDATTAGDDDSTSNGTSMDYVIFVPDNGSNQFKMIDPADDQVIYSLNLAEHNASLCPATQQGCFIFGGTHEVIEGHDYLDITYGQPGSGGGLNTGFSGNIDRVQMTSPPTLKWRLHELNFSGLPGGASAYCAADESDPCKADSSAPISTRGLCWVGDAHDFQVLSDDTAAETAELLVSDTDNYRLLKVKLDYSGGNTCGTVTSMVDTTRNSDWLVKAEPNNVVPVDYEGRELYIVNLRSATVGAASGGLIQLWEAKADGSWERHWTFPELVSGGTQHFLNLPHGGELLPGASPDGDLYWFGHSSALADAQYQDPAGTKSKGGTVDVLLFTDLLTAPDYLEATYQPSSSALWAFPRAATRIDDQNWLVTDSGAQLYTGKSAAGKLVWVNSDTFSNSSKAGYWSSDHSQQELTDVTSDVTRSLTCGLKSPYWSQIVHETTFGTELIAARAAGGSICK